jgi:hypothetical protein
MFRFTTAAAVTTFLIAVGAGEADGAAEPGATRDAGERVSLSTEAGAKMLDRLNRRLEVSSEIPAFARKYGVSCALCHAPFPRLTAFGERFAANGFEFQPGEQPTDTVDTGDDELRLQEALPLAIRFDASAQANTGAGRGGTEADLQIPFNIKLLTGGQVTDGISYYMYFFLSERGEVAGLEDAYVQFTDIGGSGVSVMAGQFQVSDPLFKRELRLEYEDYQVYRVNVGRSHFDLTYDRGVMVSYSPWSDGDLVLGVVNGRGLNESSATRQLDRDARKNGFLRYSHDLGPARLGGYVYYGSEAAEGADNEAWIFGPDATVPLGSAAVVNLQYLRREDDNPFFLNPVGAGEEIATGVDAAMAEVIWWPHGAAGDLHFTGLFNWVDADRPVIALDLGEQDGEPGYLERYTTAALGVSWAARRNVRLLGELGWDFELEEARFTTGIVTAF